MKTTILFIILATVFLGSIFLLANSIANNAEEKIKKFEEKYMGKKILIDKDTLMIIDYSLLNSTYRLSNGKDYNNTLVENNIIK